MGPIGQVAATCVSDSELVSDDRPGRLIQSDTCVRDSASVSDDRPAGLSQSAPVSDSASVSEDRPGELTQSLWRGTRSKRTQSQAKPESAADSLTAGKKIKMAKIVSMHVDRLGPKFTADMLKCWSFSVSACQGKPGRIFEKNVVRHFGDRSDDQRGIVWGGWFEPTVTVTSRSNAFRQMAHILEQKQKCDWFETVSVDPTENAWRVSEWFSMGQCVQSRKSSERAANQEAFAEASWIRSGFCRLVSATEKFFDTGALKEFGWLKINAFIGDCLYVIPSGKQCPFKEYFNGAVVLETIYFSVSDLRKDDPIQHGLLQVTVMTAPLHTVCKQLPEKQVQQFADRIGYMLQSLVFFIEASSEENKCLPQFVGCRLQNKNQLQ